MTQTMYNTSTYNQSLYNVVLDVLLASGVLIPNDVTDPIMLGNNDTTIYL